MAKIFPTLSQMSGGRLAPRASATDDNPGLIPDLPPDHRPIRIWLLLAATLVLMTLSIGGMTRLTNAGLSITEWEPIMGIIPPLDGLQWLEAFDKYKTTYEYRFVNMNMTLDEFRYIYNWEWRHRLVARLVFLAVFIPFVVFLLRGMITKSLQQKIFVVLGLIVLQGFVGWLMVQSGLRSDVKVSPYRLAVHLGLASLLFAMLIAMAIGQDDRARPQVRDLASSRLWGRIAIGLLFALILFGALVAGLRGGRTHDTWPLMEGQLFPSNMFVLSPWIANFFENPLTAQWIHRLLAYGLLISAALHWRGTVRREEPEAVQKGARWLLAGVGVQAVLGIVTVLNQVPVPLGLAHQLLAFLMLALAIWHLYEIERHSSVAESWVEPAGTAASRTAAVPVRGLQPGTGAAAAVSPRTNFPPVPQPAPGTVRPGLGQGVVRSPAGPSLQVSNPPGPGQPTRSAAFPTIGSDRRIELDDTDRPDPPPPYRRPLDS